MTIAALLTLVAMSAVAQDTTGAGAISGLVLDAGGGPAAGVRVCALDTASCATSVSAFAQNASLVPWRADHYVTGLAWTPRTDLRVTAEAYRKTYADYPVASDLPSVSLANIGDTFDVREILFPLTSAGKGYSEGIEFFIEKRLLSSKLYGRATFRSRARVTRGSMPCCARAGSTTRSCST